jgi:hypothetical protein
MGTALQAMDEVFGDDLDYAMLVKIHGVDRGSERRDSPAMCLGARRGAIAGNPDPKHISTSYAERVNLTMRMHMRRFTRLTDALKTMLAPSRLMPCTTISFASTKRSKSPPQWRLA